MDLLSSLQPWHWLILTFVILGLEALGTGGFLLGIAAASALVAVLQWVYPAIAWTTLFVIFGLLSLVLTVLYWKYFRKHNEHNDHPELNNRAAQLIGRIFMLDQDLPDCQGRIQLGDTFWKVRSEEPLLKNMKVIVSDVDGMTLLLKEQL